MYTKHQLTMGLKALSADGSFEGKLAVYNNCDLGGDVIEPGAFTKSIQERGSEVPMLWQHQGDEPIGKLQLTDTPDSLNVKGQLLMDMPIVRDKVYPLIKNRVVKGLSIGFDTIKDAMAGNQRRLKELRLWEGSIVTFPMNESAQITSVKKREHKSDFSTEYAEIQLQESAYQMWTALRSSLMSIPWAGDMSRDAKISASLDSITQFQNTYMEFIPAYLDWLTEEYSMNQFAAPGPQEAKMGRRISADTKASLTQAREHMKSADDVLTALMEDEAVEEDPDTSDSKAAAAKTEPAEVDHSAAESLIASIRSLIPAA